MLRLRINELQAEVGHHQSEFVVPEETIRQLEDEVLQRREDVVTFGSNLPSAQKCTTNLAERRVEAKAASARENAALAAAEVRHVEDLLRVPSGHGSRLSVSPRSRLSRPRSPASGWDYDERASRHARSNEGDRRELYYSGWRHHDGRYGGNDGEYVRGAS